jgi:hypothetical protein
MTIDKFIREKFPNWITDIYNQYNPPKIESAVSEFRAKNGNYKPFYEINLSKLNEEIRKYYINYK